MMKELTVKLTFLEGLLGTKSANPELVREWIASNHPEGPQDDEIEGISIDQELEKGTTVFNRDEDGTPFIFDYQVKGFFKDAQGSLQRIKKVSAYKKIVDGLIFIAERKIRLIIPDGMEMIICQRPIRVQTPQGERVALVRSEEVPAGTTCTFTIQYLDPELENLIMAWLEYGKLRGLGQWRNSGKGKFSWEKVVKE